MTVQNLPAGTESWLRRARRLFPLRRVLSLALLAFFGVSCVRPLPVGLQPPGPASFSVAEGELPLPASQENETMEGYLLRPEAPEGTQFPCAVLLHGKGGWWRAYTRYGRELASRGVASLVLNYYSVHQVDLEGWRTPFLTRKTSFEAQTADIVRATRQFARSPFCAGGKVAMVGFSLGADKAFRAAAALPEVAAVVAYYGPYDYVSFIKARVNPVVIALASQDLLKWKKYMEEASPIFLALTARTPVLLLHGVEDSLIPVAQAIKMRETLQRRGNPVTMKLYEGAGHNFVLRRGPAEVRDDSLRLTVDFLRKTLPAAKPPAAQALKEESAPSASLGGAGG